MKLALAQLDLVSRDVEANIAKSKNFAQAAAEQRADLLVLPEVFSSGFFFLEGEEAVEAGKKSEAALRDIAREHGLYVCGSFASLKKGEEKPENLFQMWGPEGKVLEYSKIHLFSFAGEDKRYKAGTRLVEAKVGGVRIRPLVCYDLRFDYCFSESAEDIDLYIVPANWPSERQTHWETLLQARAIDSQAWVAGVNRVGRGGKLDYLGGSMIVSPRGEVVARGSGSEGIIFAELDVGQVQSWRSEFSNLGDRLK